MLPLHHFRPEDYWFACSMNVFSGRQKQWTSAPNLPKPRHHCGVVRVETEIYVLGGVDPADEKSVCSNKVFKFNIITGNWHTCADMKR